jgi:hypothetical protein
MSILCPAARVVALAPGWGSLTLGPVERQAVAAPAKFSRIRRICSCGSVAQGAMLPSMPTEPFPTTEYFRTVRRRPDRAIILDEWIRHVIERPVREAVQSDGRVRRWAPVPDAGGRALRVILLPDRVTVHNAFFDRSFKP